MASSDMCIYCFDALLCHFDKKVLPKPSFENEKYPLFVSWHKKKNNGGKDCESSVLRGCKGTFTALNIHQGLQDFALISAFKDSRFHPIESNEVPCLECSVNLLFQFESCSDVYDWQIGVHGIIIDFIDPRKGKSRNATYLPQVASEQAWNKEQTLSSLIKKAGYDGIVDEALLQGIRCTRYRSSETSLHYEEYILYKKRNEKV
jgi:uncharacterized protein (TIGR00296 family)